MESIPLYAIISTYSVLIPILIGIYLFKKLEKNLKVFTYFLIISLLVEVVNSYLALNKINNLWLMNIFILIDYCFLIFIFSSWQENPKLKTYFLNSIPVFFLIWLVFQIMIGGITNFNYITRSIECIIFTAIGLYALYKRGIDGDILLLKDYKFWIILGVLIYFSGNIMLFALSKLYVSGMLPGAWIIHSGLNLASYLCFAGGFLCLRRQ